MRGSRSSNFVWNGCIGQIILMILGIIFLVVTNFGLIIIGIIAIFILGNYLYYRNDDSEKIKKLPDEIITPPDPIIKLKTDKKIFDENVEKLLNSTKTSNLLRNFEKSKNIKINKISFEIMDEQINGYSEFYDSKNKLIIRRNSGYSSLTKSMAVLTQQLLDFND